MKKMLRKILAVLVVFSVVLSVGIIAMQGGTLADNGIYYQNDFSGALDTENWSKPGSMSVSDGTLKITGETYLELASTKNLTDYVVEAKVSMDDTNHTKKSPFVGIVMYANSSNKGYEFALMRNYSAATGGTFKSSCVRLYNRIDTSAQFEGNDDMMPNQIESNVPYTLKMVIIGTKIDCYVDGALQKSFVGANTAGGGVGLKINGCNAVIDDFIVRKPTVAEGGQAESSSEVSSATSSATQQTYFSEDFNDSDAFATGGWSVSGTATALDANRVVSGAYTLGGKDITPNTYDLTANTVLNGATPILDYTVEADVWVDTNTATDKDLSMAGISARAVKGTGVELTLMYGSDGTAYVRLYNRAASGTKMLADKLLNNQILGNQIYQLKLVVIGNVVKGYVDGVLLAEGEIESNRLTKGMPGMKAQGYTAYIDNYVVREPSQVEREDTLSGNTSSSESSSSSETSSGNTSSGNTSSGSTSSGSTSSGSTSSGGSVVVPDGYYVYEPFENDSQFNSQGWSKKPTTAQLVAGHSGLQFAKPTATTVYVMKNNATLKALADYVVEADVTVDTTAPTGSGTALAGIIGRYDGDGVEMCLLFNTETGDNYVRLHDRKGGVVYTEKMLDGELQGNTVYKLKMVFNGDVVRCYVNGELLLTVTGLKTTTAGSVGLRGSIYPAYYDNLVVRPATEEEKGVVAPPQMPQADKNGVYYSTDFEDISVLQDTNWVSPMINLNDGMAVISSKLGTMSNNIGNPDFTLLTDYVVQANIIIDPENQASNSRPTIAITGRLQADGKGYELGLMGNTDGSTHWLRLYDRTTGTSLADVPVTVERGKVYTLRFVMIGNTLRGYLGDEKVIEVTDNGLATGAAGYKASGIDGFLQNFIIRKPTAAEIKGEGGAVTGGNDNSPGTGDRTLYTVFGVIAVLVLCAGLLLLLNYRKNKN